MKHSHKQPGGSEHRCLHERRIARQTRAEARNDARGKRTNAQQLDLIKNRPGNSRKERARLRKGLNKRS